jgi:Ca2+:H+ antiporter
VTICQYSSLGYSSDLGRAGIEIVTAINVSFKDQVSLSISVAVGSTIVSHCFAPVVQETHTSWIANGTFCYTVRMDGPRIHRLIPIVRLMVTFGWLMQKPLALLFDPFESVVCTFSSLAFYS